MSTVTTQDPPRRITRARDLYALPEEDSELIQSMDFKQQCVMIRARLNLPCDVEEDGYPKPISRTTVKHVHARFEDICRRFEFLFDRADEREHWGVVNALICVLGELCPDSVLCDMFFERLQLFPRLAWLLRGPIRVPWFYPLELLCMVVRRGSDSTRLAVARHPDILDVIFQSHLSNHNCVEFNNMIISHALEAAFTANPPQPELVSPGQLLKLTNSVALGLSVHGAERSSYRSASHGLVVLAMGLFRHELDNPARGIQEAQEVFAALTTSEDLSMRALGLRIFFPPKLSGTLSHSASTTPLSSRFPDNLRHLLEEHGSRESESDMAHAAADAFRAAVSTLSLDKDLCKFGSAVAELLQRGPYIPATFTNITFPSGNDIPYANLDECLLATTKALQDSSDPSHADIADIVDLGRLAIVLGASTEYAEAARAALARNPQLTYAYVALCWSTTNREEALRTAEKGLERCTDNTPPAVRRALLLSAMHDAFRKGWTFLICGELDDPNRRAWGKQFTAAGARYMDEVLRDPGAIPLDSPDLWLALHWAFIRAVLCAGPDLEAVIADLENTLLPRIEACETVLEALEYDVKASPVRRGREAYLTHLRLACAPRSYNHYPEFVRRLDALNQDFRVPFDGTPTHSDEEEDQLYARWWNVAEHQLVPATTHGPLQCACRSSGENYLGSVVLGRCNWCRKPSAILKQCARCRDALYCDGKCQRQDWPRHKSRCRRIPDESEVA